jgi:hypothetical protein
MHQPVEVGRANIRIPQRPNRIRPLVVAEEK